MKSMQISRGRKFALAVTAAIYLVAVAVVLMLVDDQTLQSALSIPATLVAALLGLSLVNYAARAWRWLIFSRILKLRVPLAANVAYYLAGYSLTATPGKAGEAVRLWFLKSGHGVPYSRSLPLMLADIVMDLWAVLLLSLASLAAFAQYRWQGAVLAFSVIVLSVPLVFPRRFEPLLSALYGLAPRCGRTLVRARRAMRAMADLANWRSYCMLGPTILGWFTEGAALYLVLRHIGADVSLLIAVSIFCFATIIGALSMLPGGLGSADAAIVILLTAIGVDLSTALVATAIIRITTFWFAVAIGISLMPAAINVAARAATFASVDSAHRP